MSTQMCGLPPGWKQVKVGEVLAGIEAGKSFNAEQRPAALKEWGVLKISALTWGEFRQKENKALLPGTEIDGIPTVQEGDILISRANTVELVGAVAMPDKSYPRLLLSDKTLRLNPDSKISDSKYLLYALRTPEARKHIESHATGTSGSMRNITQANIRNIPILLPPLEEQQRIAAILDKADEVRRKRKDAIRLTEQLLRSTFLEMFGDPSTNPKGWKIGKVIDYCDCIVPGRDKPKSFTGNTPWVTTADLNHLSCTYKSRLGIGLTIEEIAQVNARVIPKNSVLLTCVGDLGITSIAGQEMVVNQQLHAFQCKQINNFFLMYALPFQKSFMYKRATQTTVPYMNKTSCNSIPVIYPPLELQEKFADIYRKTSSAQPKLTNTLHESENLFNSLLQQAFRGEL